MHIFLEYNSMFYLILLCYRASLRNISHNSLDFVNGIASGKQYTPSAEPAYITLYFLIPVYD